MTFKLINPFSQEIIAEYEGLTSTQLNKKLLLPETAFKNWKNTSFQE